MEILHVRDNLVVDVTLGDRLPQSNETTDYYENLYGAGIGWIKSGDVFSPPPSTPIVPVRQVPVRQVDMRRAKLALHRQGLLESVNSAITSAGIEAEINWNNAQYIRRDDPLTLAIAQLLGWDGQKIDQLFELALSLPT